jgi:hypothetical protein
MVYPALLPLMRTPRLPVVDWTDAARRFKWTRPFRRKKKSGFCACAITFQLASTLPHLIRIADCRNYVVYLNFTQKMEAVFSCETFCTHLLNVTLCRMRADSAESALIRHNIQPFTECVDTRCCDNTICPPEDRHVNARNMSRIIM